MKCPSCGGDNREGARFCRHCGLALGPGAAGQETGRLPEEEGGRQAEAAPEEARVPGTSVGQETDVEQPDPAEVEGAPAEAAAESPAGAPGEQPAAAIGAEVVAGTPPEQVAVAAGAEAPAGGGAEAPVEASPPSESGEPCAPCLAPVSPGTVLDGRYLVIEMLEQQAAQIRYAARDLCLCWQCGFDANAADDAFCAQCGASLAGRRAIVPLLQVVDPQVEPPEGETLAARLDEGDAHFLVLRRRPLEPAQPAVPAAAGRLLLGLATHPGQARPLNEDSLLSLVLAGSSLRTQPGESLGRPLQLGLFAVADGMGGHEGGEVASKLALHVFGAQVVRTLISAAVEGREVPDSDVAGLLARAVEAANDAVYLARQKRENDMGTTLTAALVLDGRAVLAHVGDSRALRWSAAGLEQLTTDHSLIAALVTAGRAAPDEIYTHPQRSVVLRCIGDRATVEVDSAELGLVAGDRLVLCSDGLWEMLRNEGIADVLMQEPEPQAAADLLVARANAAGGDDNITVVVVQVA